MESFLFALNAVAPIVLTVAVGYLLKRMGLMNLSMARQLNKLVFRIFLPAMIFLNLYGLGNFEDFSLGYVSYTLLGVVVLFFLSIPVVMLCTPVASRRGAVWQASFRSNVALIGIPLTESLCGSEGVTVASLLSALTIPLLNILAVISLSAFGKDGQRPRVKKILLDILKNPLIRVIALSLAVLGVRAIFERQGIAFRLHDVSALFAVLKYLSNLATPLALLSLGAQFEFSAITALRREILTGTLMRALVSPLLTLSVAYLLFRFHFNSAQFATLVAIFATPVSVSSTPMAQEMGADAELAGQLVIWTTVASAFSIFLSTFFLSLAGVF